MKKNWNINFLDSKLIEQVSVLLHDVGTPISTGGGLTWQVEVQNYLLRNPAFTKNLVLLFNIPLKKEEKEYLCNHYIEALPEIVKVFKSYV